VTWTLRLFRDALPSAAPRWLPATHRVLYAQHGSLSVSHGGVMARVAEDSAWYGSEACTLGAEASGTTLLRWELSRAARGAGDLVLEQALALDADAAWLMRCDRVDFDPGAVALPHRHRGGGIRCLIAGALEVTVGEGSPRLVRPGCAWYESGGEPVLARASATEPTSFIRVAILPADIRGQTSIMYVDPADAARGKPRHYTVWVDTPVALDGG
jgi:quercetin dioxygenase-like cupin family protein